MVNTYNTKTNVVQRVLFIGYKTWCLHLTSTLKEGGSAFLVILNLRKETLLECSIFTLYYIIVIINVTIIIERAIKLALFERKLCIEGSFESHILLELPELRSSIDTTIMVALVTYDLLRHSSKHRYFKVKIKSIWKTEPLLCA